MEKRTRGIPAQWETSDDKFDYVPLRLPPNVSRVTASMRLAISAEFGGWNSPESVSTPTAVVACSSSERRRRCT